MDIKNLYTLIAIADRGSFAEAAIALRLSLSRVLPEHMVPQALVVLDRLPLTPNGKLDRRALAQLSVPSPDSVYVAPRTPLEEVLADLWRQVLNVDRVGVHDDFYALGGHSLLASRMAARLEYVLGH